MRNNFWLFLSGALASGAVLMFAAAGAIVALSWGPGDFPAAGLATILGTLSAWGAGMTFDAWEDSDLKNWSKRPR